MDQKADLSLPAQQDAVLQAVRLSKSFTDVRHATLRQLLGGQARQIEVLRELTFQVKKGELLGVIGHNGAGKSTLLRLLAGVYKPTGGTLQVLSTPSTLFEMGVFLDANATGRKYCRDYFEFLQVPKAEIRRLTEEIEDFIEIGPFFEKSVREYSSGMKARLLFAVATARKADIYLIDEALVVGDEYFQGKAWKHLFHLLSHGASGVIVTHDMDSVVKLCENSLYLKDGRITYCGKSYQAINEYLGLVAQKAQQISLLDKKGMGERVYSHTKGGNFTFEFSFRVDDVPPSRIMTIAFSIESRQKHGGIVHICKVDNNVSTAYRGVYDYQITLENPDLVPGEYFCTLTLGDPPENGEGPFVKIYDEKRWMRLDVAGELPAMLEQEKPLLEKQVRWSVVCI